LADSPKSRATSGASTAIAAPESAVKTWIASVADSAIAAVPADEGAARGVFKDRSRLRQRAEALHSFFRCRRYGIIAAPLRAAFAAR